MDVWGRQGEAEEVAAAVWRLIPAPRDRLAGQVTVEKGADGPMRHDRDGAAGVVLRGNRFHRPHDPRLRVHGALPPAHRRAGRGEEFVRDLFELGWRQETGGRAVVLAELGDRLEP